MDQSNSNPVGKNEICRLTVSACVKVCLCVQLQRDTWMIAIDNFIWNYWGSVQVHLRKNYVLIFSHDPVLKFPKFSRSTAPQSWVSVWGLWASWTPSLFYALINTLLWVKKVPQRGNALFFLFVTLPSFLPDILCIVPLCEKLFYPLVSMYYYWKLNLTLSLLFQLNLWEFRSMTLS